MPPSPFGGLIMTYADIKIAALKLMNASYNELVAVNIADYYDDSSLNDYLYKMNESINRCFDRLLSDNLAPQAIVEFDEEDYIITHDDYFYYMDLTQITDLFRLDRVIYTNTGSIEPNHDFLLEGDTLVLSYRTGTYKLEYTKVMPYIDDTVADSDTCDLPNEILRLIPYWIKGELYEEEDANLAMAAMNVFEARLMLMKKKKIRHQTKVVDVFKGYYD